MTKAVALLSGGLDSILAVKVIQEQQIEVLGTTFITPFFGAGNAEKAARGLNIPLRVIDITEEHLKLVRSPRYGHGKGMNPCLDCHILMVKEAGRVMDEIEASFIITGEVLGERPMSQNRQSLRIVEKRSGREGYLLRPLSARLLEPTIPEQKGLVDREKLLSIQGRSRKPQIVLANKYKLTDYPTPAGGCLLTDPAFSRRLKKLFEGQGRISVNDIELLKYGRHFFSSQGARIVVARNKEENEALLKLAQHGDMLLAVKDRPGPRTVMRGKKISQETVEQAALLTARYSQARDLPKAEVAYWFWGDEKAKKSATVKEPLKRWQKATLKAL